ncbi:MAG: DUF4397 domain-containing protein [Bradymonadales bacterium]|nr:DUF4397 domain-containing protein [Bradymonadales bacterium]
MKFFRWVFPMLVALYCLVSACSSPQLTPTTTTDQPVTLAGMAHVRFIHAIPDAPAVDVWVGNRQVATSVGFQQWTEWVEVEAGEQEVTLRRREFTELTDTYTFHADQRYLVFAWGMMTPTGDEVAANFLVSLDEDVRAGSEDSWIRFANLLSSGDSLGLVITTEGSWNLVFPNVAIGSLSEYKRGPLYQNSFEIIPARDTSLPALHRFDQHIQVGILFTFVVTGRQRDGRFEVFTVTDYRE